MMPLLVTVRLNRFSTGRHMEINRPKDKTHASATKNVIHSCHQLPHRIRTAGAPMRINRTPMKIATGRFPSKYMGPQAASRTWLRSNGSWRVIRPSAASDGSSSRLADAGGGFESEAPIHIHLLSASLRQRRGSTQINHHQVTVAQR